MGIPLIVVGLLVIFFGVLMFIGIGGDLIVAGAVLFSAGAVINALDKVRKVLEAKPKVG